MNSAATGEGTSNEGVEALFLAVDEERQGRSGQQYREHTRVGQATIDKLVDPIGDLLGLRMSHNKSGTPEGNVFSQLRHMARIDGHPHPFAVLSYQFSIFGHLVTLWLGHENIGYVGPVDLRVHARAMMPAQDRLGEVDRLLAEHGFCIVPYHETLRPYSGRFDISSDVNGDLLFPEEFDRPASWAQLFFR